MPKIRHADRNGLHIRVVSDGAVLMGPGRAELLEGVRAHGSIAAAGRFMGMSYKRAWDLVDAMNRAFGSAVVEANRGGEHGGGARLTPTGEAALREYRRIEAEAGTATRGALQALGSLRRPVGTANGSDDP